MDRRAFLKTAAMAGGAALAGTGLAPFRAMAVPQARTRLPLSITWGMFGRNRTVPEAFQLLQKFDYDGFEMFDWRRAETLDAIAAEMKKYKFECACLVANKGVTAPGCGLVNPKERDQFLAELNLSLEACKKVNCKRVVVLTGNELKDVPREQQMQNAVDSLKAAAPILERNGVTAIIEVLNTYVNHAGYFLYYIREGAQMCERVGSPNVKLLFDIYHTQIMEGHLIPNIRKYVNHVGHFHIGDNPGRHQPGTGEINYRNVFKAILETNYTGYAALEYGPTIPIEEDMPAERKLTIFS